MSDKQKRIEEKAYQFFLDRGCVHGYENEDWLRAEEEVKKEGQSKAKAAVKKPEVEKPAPEKAVAKKPSAKKVAK